MANIKCKLGFHDWEECYKGGKVYRLFRTCKRCGKRQEFSYDSQGGDWGPISEDRPKIKEGE